MSSTERNLLLLDEDLDEIESQLLSILDRSDFAGQRAEVKALFNDLLTMPDERKYMRPLLETVIAVINENEDVNNEQVQMILDLMAQRNEAYAKIAELERIVQDWLGLDIDLSLEG